MNKHINAIPLFSTALEYFDRKTGGAWRLRSCLTSMTVWAGNGHLYALQSGDPDRIAKSMITMATLRTWMHEVRNDGFALDFTSSAVAKTLGLDKHVDAHAEASRIARDKCIRSRSATKFVLYYKEAMQQLDETRRRREESVEQITELLASSGFEITPDVADHLLTFYAIIDNDLYLSDSELYDDAAVERQADQLAECLANVLTSASEVCEAEYSGAITEAKIAKLTGFRNGIRMGMEQVGINLSQLAKRKQALDALIDAQAATLDAEVKTLDEQIAAAQAQVAPDAASPKVTTVKGAAHLAKEQALLDAQNAAEQARLAKVAEFEAAEDKKRKAAMAKANRERKAQAAASVKSFDALPTLMVS
ncbi:MAG: hypothetical protein IPN20_04525 [Haliscomenobacter sp.]|nr:hypothetical protein [Haliscomenobacter sp.]